MNGKKSIERKHWRLKKFYNHYLGKGFHNIKNTQLKVGDIFGHILSIDIFFAGEMKKNKYFSNQIIVSIFLSR